MFFFNGDIHFYQTLDILQVSTLFRIDKAPSDAAMPGSSCTANAVYIRFRDIRDFVIDYVG